MSIYDVVVIGAGASGLTAAIFAARSGASVLLLEAQQRVGKKLLATGNGRCNLTNINADRYDYFTDSSKRVKDVLSAFSTEKTLEFFGSIGVTAMAEDEGRIYPMSQQAASVLDMLRFEAERRGVTTMTEKRVTGIKRCSSGFIIAADSEYRASCVVVACGGKAAPSLGGVSDGADLLLKLGHSAAKLSPVLTQIKTDSAHIGALKGMRVECVATLVSSRIRVQEKGEVLFAEGALSGIACFNLSRHLCESDFGKAKISLRLLPELSKEEIVALLKKRAADLSDLTLENYLNGMLNKRVGMCVLKAAGQSPLSRQVSSLADKDIAKIAEVICGFEFGVTGLSGWKNAQVTRGGLLLSQFDAQLQSSVCPGLYACGEVLNVDGKCGGYNLQWAWSSGAVCGMAAAQAAKGIRK